MSLSPSLEAAVCAWRRRIRTESNCWTHATITRNGKERRLRVPCGGLKKLQRRLNQEVLAVLDRERASYCRAGRGVLKAVAAHEHRPVLLHRDITRFFPSVTRRRVVKALIDVGFSERHARLIADICTVDNELPQGAPTSVTLGNLVLRNLDRRLSALCRQHGLTYTRYVDDLAISGGERRLTSLTPHIDRIIAEEGWTIGVDKGGLYLKGAYREYLGVSVGGLLDVGKTSTEKLQGWFDALERGEIDMLTFHQRTGWARAVRARSFHPKRADGDLS